VKINYKIRVTGSLFRPGASQRAINAATKETLEFGKGVIQENTPVDTGLLKREWHYRTSERMIFNEVPYSVWVEGGTKKMAARGMAFYMLPHIAKYYEEAIARHAKRELGG
jgi:hypothetical protein